MTADGSPQSPIDVIGNETSRQILAALNVERQSVKELATHCNLSEATVYRRLNRLEEHDFVDKKTVVTSDGTHYHLYECQFLSAIVQLRGTDFEVDVVREPTKECLVVKICEELRNLIE